MSPEFIAERDSFYMATVGAGGWPYVQHRGGPKGFVKVIDDRTLAFADFSGNKQYISTGNLATDDRVALIMVDYPARTRLKILGRAQIFEGAEGREWIERLREPGSRDVDRTGLCDSGRGLRLELSSATLRRVLRKNRFVRRSFPLSIAWKRWSERTRDYVAKRNQKEIEMKQPDCTEATRRGFFQLAACRLEQHCSPGVRSARQRPESFRQW